MILNSGLDHACNANSASSGVGAARFVAFIDYAAFGTSSAAPDPTDTSLGAQVGSRSLSNGGNSDVEDAGVDATNNRIWFEATFTRVFSITLNVNATEWGLGPAPTGNLSVRDLFRADPNDPNSSPITLTLENGDELHLVVTLRIEAAWEYETNSFTITGTTGNDSNGKHTGEATVSSGNSSVLNAIVNALQGAWPGPTNSSTRSYLHVINSDQSSVAKNQNVSASAATNHATLAAYTPGSFYRDHVSEFSTGQANMRHYAWVSAMHSTAGNAYLGWRYILTDPPYLDKQGTHKLTLTVRKSISRL